MWLYPRLLETHLAFGWDVDRPVPATLDSCKQCQDHAMSPADTLDITFQPVLVVKVTFSSNTPPSTQTASPGGDLA